MGKKQWVQHISGQGEKWEVCEAGVDMQRWQTAYQNGRLTMYLPKSEYCLCEPPEMWKDVTEECAVTDDKWPPHSEYGQAIAKHSCVLYEPTHWVKNESYRLRKMQLRALSDGSDPLDFASYRPQWAFIIEQKVSE